MRRSGFRTAFVFVFVPLVAPPLLTIARADGVPIPPPDPLARYGTATGLWRQPAPRPNLFSFREGERPFTPQQRVVFAPPPRTLKEALSQLDWDADKRGSLLLVNPDGVVSPDSRPRITMLGEGAWTTQPRPPMPLPPAPPGGYRLFQLADYFEQRVVAVKSLTTLAPQTMTVVNYDRLPAPDPYTALTIDDKMRLLQSTLSPAQWRKLGSADGIGAADLNSKQRLLFASLVPRPFRVSTHGRAVFVSSDNQKPDDLTEAQRAGVRLTMTRRLSWSFTTTDPARPGNISIGVGSPPDPTRTVSYSVSPSVSSFSMFGERHELFGVSLMDVVPTRSKPTDLNTDSAALDTAISLSNVTTVGGLMERVQERTKIALFCDPRYARLPIVTRGSEARAGDVLKALCWGVSGTFRKVATGEELDAKTAFVLTDDVVGLGTRQARINEWAQNAAATVSLAAADVDKVLAQVDVGQYVGWQNGDAMAPDVALAGRIEAFRKGEVGTPGQSPTDLWVPVGDLPPQAQEMVKRQITQWGEIRAKEQARASEGNIPVFSSYNAPLRTDAVRLDVQPETAFLVPGIGRVTFNDNFSSSTRDRTHSLLRRPQPGGESAVRPTVPARPAPATVTLDKAQYSVRALLLTPRTAGEVHKAVQEAKKHGFSEVWVEAIGEDVALLQEAVAAGKKEGVAVRAVVRVLRTPENADGKTSDVNADKNLLGETSSQLQTRRAQMPPFSSPFPTPLVENPATPPPVPPVRWGNWQRLDRPNTQEGVLRRLTLVAGVQGIAGVVLRDTAPPGYAGSVRAGFSPFAPESAAREFGFTPGLRWEFLTQNSVDPVDLSPLSEGRLSLPWGANGRGPLMVSVTLPGFVDYGPGAATNIFNGVPVPQRENGETGKKWAQFRAEKRAEFMGQIEKTFRARYSNVPLLREAEAGDMTASGARTPFFGTFDKPVPENATTVPSPANPLDNSSMSAEARRAAMEARMAASAAQSREAAHTQSTRALLFVSNLGRVPQPGSSAATAATPDIVARRLAGTVRTGWEGIVLDFSDLLVDDALPLLQKITP